jgi:hypothetical protein
MVKGLHRAPFDRSGALARPAALICMGWSIPDATAFAKRGSWHMKGFVGRPKSDRRDQAQ